MLQNTSVEGFINESNIKFVSVSNTPSLLIEKIKNYIPPKMENKWSELQ